MQAFKEILNFIDSTADMYPSCLLPQLTKENTLKFILKIIEASGKEIGEAVLVFLSAVKYIFKDSAVFTKLAEADAFQSCIEDNAELIMKLSIEKSVQGNTPERAFPLLEILHEKVDRSRSPINIIELGAAFGLIGRCLLAPPEMIKNKGRYFSYGQQIPAKFAEIGHYLGVELNPPDQEWLLACIWDEDHELRLRGFINDIDTDERYELIKGNAFGFSDLEPVKKLAVNPGKIIILTSFMLYQFDKKKKEMLIDEISQFTNKYNGHWINQAVSVSSDSKMNEYYISLDDKKIIELNDDTCLTWEWVNESD